MSRPRPEDMEPSGATDGQVLTWDDALGLWVPADAPSGGSLALDDLTDVDATTPSDGDVLTFDSGTGDWIPAAPTGGGGGTTINDRRWVRGSTAHAQDDEFNDSSLDAAWGRVDAVGGTGRATWTEDGDSLSLLLAGGDATGELHAMVRPYVLAVGESIQCHMVCAGPPSSFPGGGLIVANGATYGSGLQEFLNFFNSNTSGALWDVSPSEWSGYNSRTAQTDSSFGGWGLSLHMRLKRSATNTYQHFASPDGISWTKVGADRTQTMTPSHVGFAGTTYSGSTPHVFSFDYFRVI